MMPKPKNRARKTAVIFLILFVISAFTIFVPSLAGMDMMTRGYAIAFLLFFLSICFLITCIVFFGMARRFDASMAGNEILAHWEYPKSQWLEFVEKEYIKQRKGKWALFYLIAAITFIIVVIFIIIKRDSWLIMIIILFIRTCFWIPQVFCRNISLKLLLGLPKKDVFKIKPEILGKK
jgi:hypothetical protein